jgi:acetyltransferase-like isoleucine patch superfamily enzyme
MPRRLRQLAGLPAALWRLLVTELPGEAGQALRHRHWRKRLRRLGEGVRIDPGVSFQGAEFIEIGDRCWIDRGVMILAGPDRSAREKIARPNPAYQGEPGGVQIGRNVHVGPGTIVSGLGGGVSIADDCGISAGCRIYALTHHYRSRRDPSDRSVHFAPRVPPEQQCLVEGPVVLGRNTGLALGAILLPGVHVPEDCFVGIGSVVAKGPFPSNSLIAGDPAGRVADRYRQPGAGEPGADA